MELDEIQAEVVEQENQDVNEAQPEEEAQPEPEAVETPEPEADPDPTEIVRNLPKRGKTATERIAEMTWKQREAERQAEYWKQIATQGKPPAQPAAAPSDRPRLESYDTTEEYEDALLSWHLERKSAETAQKRQKEEEATALRQFNEKAQKIREIHEDFDEVVEAPVFTKVMRDVLLKSEHGPVIAYYLGRPENYAAAQKIASLPTELQPYEIGKLETQLLIAQRTKKVPSAPPPITPVGSASPGQIDESKLSDDEWYALERKRQLEKLKSKYSGG